MTRNPFHGLPWHEKLTYGVLCLTLVSIALWWRIGIFAIVLLIIASIVKLIHTKRFGNPTLGTLQRVCLWAMVAYWLLYAISAIISTNHVEARLTASIKLYFFVLPLLCLCNDTTYLSRSRIRALFQVFTATLLLRMLACSVAVCIDLVQGAPFSEVMDWQIDPLGMHHNYLALYINTALVFLYVQIVRLSQRTRRRQLPFMVLAATTLIAYLFLIASRSGLLTFGLLAIAAFLHLTFIRKKWKLSLCLLFLSAGLLAGVCLAIPNTFSRFTTPLRNRDANHVADEREIIWSCSLKTAQKQPVFGYGSGDYMPALLEAYTERGYMKAVREELDCHNQYLETLLETGIVGLALLLFMLFTPFAASLRKGHQNLLVTMTILVIVGQMAFESMLNRQMGSQFISLIYCILILSLASLPTTDSCTPVPTDN